MGWGGVGGVGGGVGWSGVGWGVQGPHQVLKSSHKLSNSATNPSLNPDTYYKLYTLYILIIYVTEVEPNPTKYIKYRIFIIHIHIYIYIYIYIYIVSLTRAWLFPSLPT